MLNLNDNPNQTVDAILTQAEQDFTAAGLSYGHGTTNAFDEAVWLVLHAMGQPLDDLESVLHTTPTADQAAKIQALIAQRIRTRKPAAYLTQEAWLVGLPFYVDERAIVPRSYIAELLADEVFDGWMPKQPTAILDLCTGNGSLALIAALAYPEVRVDGLDISPEALEVAAINLQRYQANPEFTALIGKGKKSRVRFTQSDLYQNAQGPYDCILSNPPYVNEGSMQALPAEYQAEPRLALSGGDDGMDLVRKIIAGAKAQLKPDGFLVLEIGNEVANMERAFPDLALNWLEVSAGAEQVCLIEYDDLP